MTIMIFWKARGDDTSANINTKHDCRHSGKNPKTNRKKTTNNWIESMNAKRINIKLYYNTICLYDNKNPRNRHCDVRQLRRYLRMLAYIIYIIYFSRNAKKRLAHGRWTHDWHAWGVPVFVAGETRGASEVVRRCTIVNTRTHV